MIRELLVGKYIIICKCNNCNEKQEVKIQKGKTIKDFMEDNIVPCKNCGCYTLVPFFLSQNNYKGGKR